MWVTVYMGYQQAPPPGPGGEGPDQRSSRIALAVAVPLSVFLAVLLCLATGIALTMMVVHTGGSGEEAPPAAESEEPGPEKEEAEEESDEEDEERASGRRGPAEHEVPPSSYDGTSTWSGNFRVECETAYTDTTITDGMGSSQTAPSGSEFHIYRLHVTNEGDVPDLFDTVGTTATTTDGRELTHDEEAEWTVAWDYFGDDIDPGQTVTTYVVLTAPEGTRFTEVRIGGSAVLEPRT
ncbi:hypothetical protein GCM10007147_06080 [Nocardiopsis kunsanensis]|uniref:DUF4352 domain-containing protein n=1 Tax=Nocardiopsis kunsanensis TaxID=141693 RepID=A0A919CF03_9ACTN|nr:DUF4352 domain-containing protein [Nocardiopsis kunsanensis]GHD17190.1 hypothetical protein GCM10007147_06080 [Nocardiopsis kunsanensis]